MNVCGSPQKTKVEHRKIFSLRTRIGSVDFRVEAEQRREVNNLSTSIGETFGYVKSYRGRENVHVRTENLYMYIQNTEYTHQYRYMYASIQHR